MSTITVNHYKISFILDLRAAEGDVQKTIDDIKQVLVAIGGEATAVEDLGVRDFARTADRRFQKGHYVQMLVTGPATVPVDLRKKLKHEKRINRIFTESYSSI